VKIGTLLKQLCRPPSNASTTMASSTNSLMTPAVRCVRSNRNDVSMAHPERPKNNNQPISLIVEQRIADRPAQIGY
jgi:hypothetical protein